MTGNEFVSRIDALLKQKNQKRLALANYLNITPQSFTDWDKRGNFPKADVLYKISQYFGVSMEYLLTGKETNPDTQKLNNLLAQLQELINTNRNTPFTSPKTYGHQEDNPQADTSKA